MNETMQHWLEAIQKTLNYPLIELGNNQLTLNIPFPQHDLHIRSGRLVIESGNGTKLEANVQEG